MANITDGLGNAVGGGNIVKGAANLAGQLQKASNAKSGIDPAASIALIPILQSDHIWFTAHWWICVCITFSDHFILAHFLLAITWSKLNVSIRFHCSISFSPRKALADTSRSPEALTASRNA